MVASRSFRYLLPISGHHLTFYADCILHFTLLWFYIPRNYTSAFHYYTRPGATALDNPQRIAAIEDIRAQRLQNPVILGCAAVLVLLEMLFVMFFHVSPVSGASRLVPGIICTVLFAGLVGYGFVRYRKLPFDGQRFLIVGVFALWMVFTCILALA